MRSTSRSPLRRAHLRRRLPTGSSTPLSPHQLPRLAPSARPRVSDGGGTSVIITGTNFTAPALVYFGSNAATNVTVVSPTEITATSPAGSVGAVNVTVTTEGGSSATSAGDVYTYTGSPAVSSISPEAGPLAGGTSVSIAGPTSPAPLQWTSGRRLRRASRSTRRAPSRLSLPPGSGTVDVTVTNYDRHVVNVCRRSIHL